MLDVKRDVTDELGQEAILAARARTITDVSPCRIIDHRSP